MLASLKSFFFKDPPPTPVPPAPTEAKPTIFKSIIGLLVLFLIFVIFIGLLVGDSGAGKTSMLTRYADDFFTESCYAPIG